ncbi:hypothetical protein FSP39_008645 [Pinctada imbricata]|uniref:TIR domain-containing protein n=1 Tax=Pinctada imbricata TaxID=66713 RepID=A0AA88Y2V5_PINIB|nr:hypothetical protein FSP39_008645 [Pinctada imbricata]
MPSHLKDKTFLDVLVIHGHKGERRHESLDEFVQQIEDEQVKVALFNKGEWGFTAKEYHQYITEDALDRCCLIFLFMDEFFIRDWVHISSTEPIGKLLYDSKRKYRLIPIQAIPPEKLDNRKLPMPLDSLTPLTYYRKDQQYLTNLRRILAKNKHKRKEAEENHKRIQEEWLKNNFNEYKDMPNTEEDGEWPNDKPSQSIPAGKNTYIYVEKAEYVISGNKNKVKNVYFSPNTQEEYEESQSHRPSTRFQHTDSTETGYHSMNFPDNGDESRDCGPYSTGVNEASLSSPGTPLDNIASMTDCMTPKNNSKEIQQKFHSFTPTELTGQPRQSVYSPQRT